MLHMSCESRLVLMIVDSNITKSWPVNSVEFCLFEACVVWALTL